MDTTKPLGFYTQPSVDLWSCTFTIVQGNNHVYLDIMFILLTSPLFPGISIISARVAMLLSP